MFNNLQNCSFILRMKWATSRFELIFVILPLLHEPELHEVDGTQYWTFKTAWHSFRNAHYARWMCIYEVVWAYTVFDLALARCSFLLLPGALSISPFTFGQFCLLCRLSVELNIPIHYRPAPAARRLHECMRVCSVVHYTLSQRWESAGFCVTMARNDRCVSAVECRTCHTALGSQSQERRAQGFPT